MTTVWRNRLFLAAPFLGALILAVITPSDDGPTVCPVALFTGTACPGCGMTRAASYLVRGDIGAAFALHPLVVVVAAQLVGAWAWFLLRRIGKVRPMPAVLTNTLLIGTALALMVVWVMRFAAGTLPSV